MRHAYKITFVLGFVFFCVPRSAAQESWQSSLVYFDKNHKLEYIADKESNRIPDFSFAGYRNSEAHIPYVPVVKTIHPIQGDNTAHIQKAIDLVGNMKPDKNGFRGTLLLKAGEYDVHGTLYLKYSGVVLRGEGDGADRDKNTVINGIGDSPKDRTILVAGGGTNSQWEENPNGSRIYISDDFVQIGSSAFEVEDASGFSEGDNIIINHPCNSDWIEAVDHGGTNGDENKFWAEGLLHIAFNRYIRKIEGNRIWIDVPVYNHLDKRLSRSYVYKYDREGILTNIGIENLRIDIHTLGRTDIKNHARSAISLCQLEDAWVKGCTMLHFWDAGLITYTASRVTVVECKALEPYGVITGGQRYNFHMNNASQQILIYRCHATDGRHAYVSNGWATVSGIVVLDCTQARSYTSSESHSKWSQGILFDNLIESETRKETEGGDRVMGFYNRGDWGNGHGWGAAHCVFWNCDANSKSIVVQKPPSAQNYAIGCFGLVTGNAPPAPFESPEGYIEGTNRGGLLPVSLFKTQYKERTGMEFK